MKLLPSLAGGLAGIITVSLINKVLRQRGTSRVAKMGLSIAGGLVGAAVTRWLEHRNKQSVVSPYNPPVESYKPVVDITV